MQHPDTVWTTSLAVSWLALFSDYLLMTLIIPLFPMLGASEMATGMLFASKACMQILAAPLFSTIIDKCGLKLLFMGLIVDAVSNLSFAFSMNYHVWLFARIMQGIASAAVIPASLGHIQRMYSHDEDLRADAFGTVTTGILAGVMIGPPMGGILFTIHPSLPFILVTCIVLAAAAMCVHVQRTVEVPVPHPSKSTGISTMIRDKDLLVSLGALLFANMAISALEATFGIYGLKALGLGPSAVGILYLFSTIPTMLASKCCAPLQRYCGVRWYVVCGGLILQGTSFMLGPKSNLFLEVVSFVGLGTGMGLIDGTAPEINSAIAKERYGGSTAVHSLSICAIQVGFIIGPLLGNYLMEHINFWGMSFMLGLFMVLYSPVMRRLDYFETSTKHERSPLVDRTV
eukprot:TRINITY_DN3752_c0_g4_i1.p1 TRINITY_DN3752_c0_g4~~TRINITY_DN3752_c0_g4_i1.p1  ORF type:complete len:409 (+),score=48.42 TRINITY_DN3752_c0_g4_i1:27-1229(+)